MSDFSNLLLDESPDAVVGTTPEGLILFWSQGAARLFGYAREEVLGRSVYDVIVTGDYAEDERGTLHEALQHEVSVYESVRCRKDGSLVYVDISRRVLYDDQGRLRLILSTKKDITELRMLRDARAVEARFRNVLESVPDGIIIANSTGRIIFTNRQADELFGYPAGALRGKAVEVLLPERFRGPHVLHRTTYLNQPRTRTMGSGLELYGLRLDGTEFPVEISLSPVETEEGTLVMSAIRDITERKRFEQALQEKNAELAQASRAKDAFLASMSHELHMPLNAIIGFTGTLLMKLPGPLTPDQEKQLGTVRGSANHLLSLINDLLDVAKIAADKVELVFEEVDYGAMVEDVAATLKPLAATKGLQFEIEIPPQRAPVNTDRRPLNQIIINLVNNAIKFTDAGWISVHFLQQARDGRTTTEFIVEDTGIGIHEADQARLFATFSRVETGTGRYQ
ncbi:MAG: PAS domain S-box protein [Candidatus Protistobacter heckmanni]|nr:PAS domain S-box protein [Candidatus Protistobacter heckmanni]